MTTPTYAVTVTRDENLWAARVDGLPPGLIGVTDVTRFADIEVEVRDLVAGLADTDPDAFDLTWHYAQSAGSCPGSDARPRSTARGS